MGINIDKPESTVNEKPIKPSNIKFPEKRNPEPISIFEFIFTCLFLSWFFFCLYAGIQHLYFDKIITNQFNLVIGDIITAILSIELGMIILALIIGCFLELLNIGSSK